MNKNQTKLEIISRRETVTAQSIVKGNTVTFAYENTDGQTVGVSFSVQRGTQGKPEFTGQEALRGSVYGKMLNIENHTHSTEDLAMYDEIFNICQDIITPEKTANETESL